MKTPEQLAALAKPTVHSNGTNGNDLFEQYREAMTAVDKALTLLNAVTVHGRDYYVQPGDALHQAIIEQDARREKLIEVYDELLYITTYLQEYANVVIYGRKV